MRLCPLLINVAMDRLLRGGPDLSAVQSARGLAYSLTPTSYYFALLINEPTEHAQGHFQFNTGDEVTYTNYARLAVARSLTGWLSTQGNTSASSGTSGTITPAANQFFGLCTTSTQTVRYIALCVNNTRASTGNPALAYWMMDTPMNLMNTSPGFYPLLLASALTIRMDD